MLAEGVKVREEFSVVGKGFSILSLQSESVSCLVNLTRLVNMPLFAEARFCRHTLVTISLELCNRTVQNNLFGVVRVEVALHRRSVHVTLQAIAAMEVLAHVTTDMMVDQEFTAGMLGSEVLTVNDELINDNELPVLFPHLLLEFFAGHDISMVLEHVSHV